MTSLVKYTNDTFDSILHSKDKEDEIKDLAYIVSYDFVYAIKESLKERGISQDQLATAIGVSPSYVSQVFNSSRLINIPFITRVRLALGMPLELVDTSNYVKAGEATLSVDEYPETIDTLYEVLDDYKVNQI